MNHRNSEQKTNAMLVRRFKTMGDEKRFHILNLLQEGNLCVGALARILNITKPAVSQHLKLLREAGLVKGEKVGYWTHYQVEKEALQETIQALEKMTGPGRTDANKDPYVCLKNIEKNIHTERRSLPMCKSCCEQKEKLKTTPEACTPEQIKECHGENLEHPCECDNKE